MRHCGSCGTTPCRFTHPLIEKETPVAKDKDEHTEIIGGAEVVVRGNEAGLDTGDYSDHPEVVAVLEDDESADAALLAQGYRRRGVIVVGEQDLWNVLGFDITKAMLRHIEFSQATMTWKVYLDSETLPLVAPYTEARQIDYGSALELFGRQGFSNDDWKAVAVSVARWVDEASGTNFWAALTDEQAQALRHAMDEDTE